MQTERLFGLRWLNRSNEADDTIEIARCDFCAELSNDPARDMPDEAAIQVVPGGPYLRERLKPNEVDTKAALAQLARKAPERHSVKLDRTRPMIEIHLQWKNDPITFRKTELLVPVTPH